MRATKLTGTDKVIQLLECCDDQLRKDLTRTANGTLAEKTEDEVLTAMRSLAVREDGGQGNATEYAPRPGRTDPCLWGSPPRTS